jgi:hypothetical protein
MKKNKKYLEKLLQKYLEAKTSVEEEFELRDIFASMEQKLDPKLYWARDLFAYSRKEALDSINSNKSKVLEETKSLRFYKLAAAIAALIVTSLGVYRLEENYKERKIKETYTETRKAFMLIAKQFELAQEQTVYLEYMDQTMNKLLK